MTATASITTHNGTFTVHNPATGEHRTFKVSTVQQGDLEGRRIVALLTGPDNTNSYTGFGFVRPDGQVQVWRSKRAQAGQPATQWERYGRFLQHLDAMVETHSLQVDASTRCRKCNRPLTTPESIASGIGPVCEGREA